MLGMGFVESLFSEHNSNIALLGFQHYLENVPTKIVLETHIISREPENPKLQLGNRSHATLLRIVGSPRVSLCLSACLCLPMDPSRLVHVTACLCSACRCAQASQQTNMKVQHLIVISENNSTVSNSESLCMCTQGQSVTTNGIATHRN